MILWRQTKILVSARPLFFVMLDRIHHSHAGSLMRSGFVLSHCDGDAVGTVHATLLARFPQLLFIHSLRFGFTSLFQHHHTQGSLRKLLLAKQNETRRQFGASW